MRSVASSDSTIIATTISKVPLTSKPAIRKPASAGPVIAPPCQKVLLQAEALE